MRGAGLGEAGLSGGLPEEVPRIVRARDEIRRKEGRGRKKELKWAPGSANSPWAFGWNRGEWKRRRGMARKE